MKKFWIKKAIGFVLLGVGLFSLLSFIVMSLWNGILAVVVHVGLVNFWQAAGILLLSKILFGFGGGGWKRRDQRGFGGKREMMEKWNNMTPEEKVKFKQEFKNRCGRGGWGAGFEQGPFEATKKDETGL